MTPREALARIAALIVHDADDRGGDTYDADEVRAVLAEVSPEQGGDPYCGRPSGGERCGVCGSRQSCYPELREIASRGEAAS